MVVQDWILDSPGRPETAFGPIRITAGIPILRFEGAGAVLSVKMGCSVVGEDGRLPRFGCLGECLFEEGGRVGFVERGLEALGADITPVVCAFDSPNSHAPICKILSDGVMSQIYCSSRFAHCKMLGSLVIASQKVFPPQFVSKKFKCHREMFSK
jgi:hypothetical protein